MTVTVTASALGRHLDLSRQRVVQLSDEGVIERRADDRFDQDAARVAYLRWLRSEDRRGAKTEADGRLRDARAREVELRIAEREHRLIDMVEHESVLVEVIGIVTTALDGLPARVTRDLNLRAVIEAEINATLNRASDRAEARARELKATGTVAGA
jgi:phage terminase Nu1 subunit (DNA packaging protein)